MFEYSLVVVAQVTTIDTVSIGGKWNWINRSSVGSNWLVQIKSAIYRAIYCWIAGVYPCFVLMLWWYKDVYVCVCLCELELATQLRIDEGRWISLKGHNVLWFFCMFFWCVCLILTTNVWWGGIQELRWLVFIEYFDWYINMKLHEANILSSIDPID